MNQPTQPPADESRPTVTVDPDRDGVILHLPEINYLDTQVWSVDVGLSRAAMEALRGALAVPPPSTQPGERRDRYAAAIRDEVRLRLGPNALTLAEQGRPVQMNFSEAQTAADAAMAVADAELAELWDELHRRDTDTDQPHAKPADRAVLRDRIADILAEADGWVWGSECDKARSSTYRSYQQRADAVLAVLPATDRAALLHETADIAESLRQFEPASGARWAAQVSENVGILRVATELRRLANEAEFVATPCAPMVPCEDGGEPCDVHERLMSHHDGSHELCAPNCETADGPRRVAAEEQPAETQAQHVEPSPVCQGFQWIGQSFATCDRCGHPAWDHRGEDVAVEGAGPFDNRRTVRPWKPGEADRIRAKWGTPVGGEQPDTQETRRCAHTDIVFGLCILPSSHHGECFHEKQPIRIDDRDEWGDGLCDSEYPGDDNFVGQLCALPDGHFGEHRRDEAITGTGCTVLLRWANQDRP